ncbi:hypothetical protein BH10ACI1_BH10ACI1_34180 [soil metagenome]
MSKFTNPLDNIRVASPCAADWNTMVGNERQKHCGDCKLNVYNLSGMTRTEAEKLLMDAEGRLCVRFYRRADGTILTKDCPVGWRAIKRNAARVATAVFSLITGLFGGILAFNSTNVQSRMTIGDVAIEKSNNKDSCNFSKEKNTGNVTTMGTPVPIMGNFSLPRNETPKNSSQERERIKGTGKQ